MENVPGPITFARKWHHTAEGHQAAAFLALAWRRNLSLWKDAAD
jgi:hypothetical protein